MPLPLSEAIQAGKYVIRLLEDSCSRISLAGSIRRRKPLVDDVEIVAKPKTFSQTTLLGQTPMTNTKDLQSRIISLIEKGVLELGPPNPGHTRPPLGPRYYRLWIPAYNIQLDLFVVLPPAQWGIIYALRTGPAEFSRYLVTKARRLGMRVEGGQLWVVKDGMKVMDIPCPTEIDFFKALGERWIPPEQRDQYVRELLKTYQR